MIMEDIAASDDRVVVHQALKHLVVAGNALIYMGPKGLKMYPLNRYVVDRDGNGNVIEIVTKERVHKNLVKKFFPDYKEPIPNPPGQDGESAHSRDAGRGRQQHLLRSEGQRQPDVQRPRER